MKKIYSIKDTKGAFLDPVLADNDALAVRNVKTAVNGQKGSLLAMYPEDFELWCIGDFDETTGLIVPGELRCVVRCNALLDHVQDA